MREQTEKSPEQKKLDNVAVECISLLNDILGSMADLKDCCSIYATLKCIEDITAQDHIPFSVIVITKQALAGG